jgi:hypothetical protein
MKLLILKKQKNKNFRRKMPLYIKRKLAPIKLKEMLNKKLLNRLKTLKNKLKKQYKKHKNKLKKLKNKR